MSWRTVVISSNAKLDYQIGYIVVRGQDTYKIHLNEISTLIVESTAVSLTAYLLEELMKHKVKLNKIAARWPAKAVAQFSTFSKKGSDRIVPR